MPQKRGSTPKRPSTSGNSLREPAAKRRKTATAQLTIGAQSEADSPKARIAAPSSSSASIRIAACPSLVTLCVRVFVADTTILSREWARHRALLQTLPAQLLRRIFAAMKSTCPQVMTHNVVHSNFFRGQYIALSEELPVSKATISSLAEMADQLTELELVDFSKYSDDLFASTLRKLPSLVRVVLRGCSKVSTGTAQAIANTCSHLKIVNLGYTAVPPVSISDLLTNCGELETLKLAGIPNWTDGTFSKLLTKLTSAGHTSFPSLLALKLRQTALTETTITPFLVLCPSLRRLDASFIAIHHLPPSPLIQLEKLSIKSTGVPISEILRVLPLLSDLRILSLGALGSGQGSNAMIRNSSAMSLTDDCLLQLIPVLMKLQRLESLDLVGNTKLGTASKVKRPLRDLVKNIGRRCKYLNLGGIISLNSGDLAPLMPDEATEERSALEALILSNTSIEDEASAYIAACPRLINLDLSGTRLSRDGVFQIIESCPQLEKLDLTSCRGIRVTERRRFFEVWKEEMA